MDPALSEIDQLISTLTSDKKVGSADINVDEDFLDSVLKEITRGDVSNLDTIDDHALAVFTPSSKAPTPVAQQTNQLNFGNNPVANPSVTYANIGVVNHPVNSVLPVATNGITVTYQLADQQVVILDGSCVAAAQNGVPVIAMTLPTQNVASPEPPVPNPENTCIDFQPTPVPSASPTPVPSGSPTPVPSGSPTPVPSGSPTPGPSGSRKRKLYEEEEFPDPVMEKKRQNAINAKRHRDSKNTTIQKLQVELKTTQHQRDSLQRENEELKKDKSQNLDLIREVEKLRKEKEEMKQKLQAFEEQYQHSQQQDKLGFSGIFDFFQADF